MSASPTSGSEKQAPEATITTASIPMTTIAGPKQWQAPLVGDAAAAAAKENAIAVDAATSKQLDLNQGPEFGLSPLELERRQLTRLTRWLCAIIIILVVIVMALILFDNDNSSSSSSSSASPRLRNSRAKMLLDHFSGGGGLGQIEQGRLMAASSDNHFHQLDSSSPDSPLDSDHLDSDQEDDDDSNSGGGSDNEDARPPQLRPPSNNKRKKHNNNNRQDLNSNSLLDQPGGKPQAALKVHRDPDAICMTPGCVRAAAQILNNMDNNTQPCQDFYQFACGRWVETQLIPDEKTSLSVFSQSTADLNIKLRALIEQKAGNAGEDPPIVGQLRNMYASCMNLSDIEARGDTPLLEVLEYLGGWPVLTIPTVSGEQTTSSANFAASDNSNGNSNGNHLQASQLTQTNHQQLNTRRQNDRRRSTGRESSLIRRRRSEEVVGLQRKGGNVAHWMDIIIKFRQRGFSHDMIVDLSIVPDVRNSRRYIIELDQSSLGLPDRSYYFKGLNDSTVAAYYQLMVESATLLGASRLEARNQMAEALDFETSLARISVPREQRRNVTRLYNKMLARDLYTLAPNIDWATYLRALLKDDQLDMERDEVIVRVPSFLRALDKLLAETEPRIVANYMIWRIVRHSMNGLSRKWRELAHSYNQVTTGRQVEEPRWEQCLGSLDGTLGTALSALYVKAHFNGRSKAAALEMVDYIRNEFLRILDEVDWMDEETRQEARLKARSIATYIGYPDELLQDELVEQLYAGISLGRTNFYQNIRSLRIWSTDYAFSQLRKPNKRGDWKKHARAAVVNAFYNSLENSIEFPAGILQGAFFDAERPNYMNFGAIGYVIGHEITHGFDDRGRQFDREGNDRNWWKPKTDARFRERAQCIVDQYANYTVAENGLKLNGQNTQGENIADNGGIKEAFRAYKRWTKDHQREARLPGLNYTPDQLFWISAANIWCGKFRPEVLKLRVNSGVHAPARFRIIGPLSNAPEFAQSFNCPLGSPMNPHKKCSVW